jgi:hypothetical protein
MADLPERARELADKFWKTTETGGVTWSEWCAALLLAELQAVRERTIEDVRMAFVANNWRGEGGWLPFVNKVLNTLKHKERNDADAE